MTRGKARKGQPDNMVFALDIGTRSIIGMVGTVEEDRVKIVAIERAEHAERAMIDGQIENIDKVAGLAKKVKKKLEDRVGFRLHRVSVAAAGRALRTKRAEYEMELPRVQTIDDETISRLEAGAISLAEEAFEAEHGGREDTQQYYLVGYTVCQYYLDHYMISSLKDHRGKQIKADLIATFLPSEVVESLYVTMNKIGLEVVSITLEPIAAINVAIPANLRLLNLVMVDIGAGTSDIAACTGGGVTGYTMATMAGDEITEAIMREYLVDFSTAENMKMQMEAGDEIVFSNILGLDQKLSKEELLKCVAQVSDSLCKEIAEKILVINGNAPSAVFLAGGGSKLAGLREGLAEALGMEASRVAIAGNYFQTSAFSDKFDLNNPEYATPLGIVVSSGLNLINDSFRVTLNGKPAKLFRSGDFTVLSLLMMNGYGFRDIIGRSGTNISVTVNGRRKVFFGTMAQPSSLYINQEEGKLSTVIHAGDTIDFVPAIQGESASACLGDIEGAATCLTITLNGAFQPLETPLKNGDLIVMVPDVPETSREREKAKEAEAEEMAAVPAEEGGDTSVKPKNKQSKKEAQAPKDELKQMILPFDAEKQESASAHTGISGDHVESGGDKPESAGGSEEALEFVEVRAADMEAGLSQADVPETEYETDALKPTDRETVSEEAGESLEPEQPDSLEDDELSGDETEIDWLDDDPEQPGEIERKIFFTLNGKPLYLPPKADENPYYLMDLLQYSDIDLKNPKGTVTLAVNGESGMFQQPLASGDVVVIVEDVK